MLHIWVVYDHPSDYPNNFVAREWIGEKATGNIVMSVDLELVRQTMRDMRLLNVTRFAEDDPVILEVWL